MKHAVDEMLQENHNLRINDHQVQRVIHDMAHKYMAGQLVNAHQSIYATLAQNNEIEIEYNSDWAVWRNKMLLNLVEIKHSKEQCSTDGELTANPAMRRPMELRDSPRGLDRQIHPKPGDEVSIKQTSKRDVTRGIIKCRLDDVLHEDRPLADSYSKRYLVTTTDARTGKEKNHLMDRQSLRVVKRGKWQPLTTIREHPDEREDQPEERRSQREQLVQNWQQFEEPRFLEHGAREAQRLPREEEAPTEARDVWEPKTEAPPTPEPQRQKRYRRTNLEMLGVPRNTVPDSGQNIGRVTRSRSQAANMCAAIMEDHDSRGREIWDRVKWKMGEADDEDQMEVFVKLVERIAQRTYQAEETSKWRKSSFTNDIMD